MKICVNREKFLKSLQKVSSIIGSRSMLPVLGNILFYCHDGVLELVTTDLEIRIATKLECQVEEEGRTTVPAKKLLALVSRFTGEEVTLSADENDHIKLDCGTGHFTLLGLSAADFPNAVEFAVTKEIKMKESEFKSMLNSISYAVSADDSRKIFTGILFNTNTGVLTMVATDSKRLAVKGITPELIKGDDGNSVIPLKAANEVKRIVDGSKTLNISIGDKQCSFATEDFVLTSKLIEGNYPDYTQVIPKSFQHCVELPSDQLLSKIETVSQVLSESSSYIILTFENNKLTIKASSSEVGEGSDSIDVKYEGEPVEISFNPVYLADPLRFSTAETATIKMNDPFNPASLEGKDGFLYVIMPIRKK